MEAYFGGETRFVWRQSEPFVFELRITEEIDLEPESNDEAATNQETAVEEPDGPWPWISIRYGFKAVPTDVGMMVGMVEPTADRDWFFWSLAPLAYDGPLEA